MASIRSLLTNNGAVSLPVNNISLLNISSAKTSYPASTPQNKIDIVRNVMQCLYGETVSSTNLDNNIKSVIDYVYPNTSSTDIPELNRIANGVYSYFTLTVPTKLVLSNYTLTTPSLSQNYFYNDNTQTTFNNTVLKQIPNTANRAFKKYFAFYIDLQVNGSYNTNDKHFAIAYFGNNYQVLVQGIYNRTGFAPGTNLLLPYIGTEIGSISFDSYITNNTGKYVNDLNWSQGRHRILVMFSENGNNTDVKVSYRLMSQNTVSTKSWTVPHKITNMTTPTANYAIGGQTKNLGANALNATVYDMAIFDSSTANLNDNDISVIMNNNDSYRTSGFPLYSNISTTSELLTKSKDLNWTQAKTSNLSISTLVSGLKSMFASITTLNDLYWKCIVYEFYNTGLNSDATISPNSTTIKQLVQNTTNFKCYLEDTYGFYKNNSNVEVNPNNITSSNVSTIKTILN